MHFIALLDIVGLIVPLFSIQVTLQDYENIRSIIRAQLAHLIRIPFLKQHLVQ